MDAGFQYRFIPRLMVRAGMSTAVSLAWFGAGFTFKSFRLDGAGSFIRGWVLPRFIIYLQNLKRRSKVKSCFCLFVIIIMICNASTIRTGYSATTEQQLENHASAGEETEDDSWLLEMEHFRKRSIEYKYSGCR